ncbi:hypothetical protein KCP78_03555 [Salmonella enterica subsp. enterica]|nr:hypothetical protein KCP78_03555 [Salmonella enterica subsp. enterica]
MPRQLRCAHGLLEMSGRFDGVMVAQSACHGSSLTVPAPRISVNMALQIAGSFHTFGKCLYAGVGVWQISPLFSALLIVEV